MKKLLNQEIISYLIFGVLTTLVYIIIRRIAFDLLGLTATISAVIANAISICFAFFTNDKFVFRQAKTGWKNRFIKFFTARLGTLILDLLMAELFVQRYPQLIGQFVNHDIQLVDTIETIFAQVLIIVGNYLISKFLIFKNKQA